MRGSVVQIKRQPESILSGCLLPLSIFGELSFQAAYAVALRQPET
nr:hypothetical protein [uncultured Kingella sp.]